MSADAACVNRKDREECDDITLSGKTFVPFFFALKLERWTTIVSISIHLYMLYDSKDVLHPFFFSRVIIAQKLGAVLHTTDKKYIRKRVARERYAKIKFSNNLTS